MLLLHRQRFSLHAGPSPPGLAFRRALAGTAPLLRSWRAMAIVVAAAGALAGLLVAGVWDAIAGIASVSGDLNADALRDALRPLGMWAPLVYVLVQAAQVLVPFLPAAPVTFAGVLLFGWKAGFALSMGGWMLGSAVQFAAVRRWGRPLVARLVGEEALARHAGGLDPRGWWLLAAFLVPFAPADAFSALAGLSAISFRRFLLVTFLGRLPWAGATTLLAAGAIGGSAAAWAIAGPAAAAALVLALAYHRRLGG